MSISLIISIAINIIFAFIILRQNLIIIKLIKESNLSKNKVSNLRNQINLNNKKAEENLSDLKTNNIKNDNTFNQVVNELVLSYDDFNIPMLTKEDRIKSSQKQDNYDRIEYYTEDSDNETSAYIKKSSNNFKDI